MDIPLVRQLKRRDWFMLLAGALLMMAIIFLARTIHNAQAQVPYQSQGITARWIPATVKHWSGPINEMGKKYNVDPNLIAIVMTLESGGNPKAKSNDNAQGLMQVTPPTAKDIAKKYLKVPVSHYDLYDPRTNIEFGTAYLAFLRDEFGEPGQGPSWNATVELIAAGYNGGPLAANRVYTGKGLTDTQTVIYSRDAFNMWRERVSGTSPTFDRWKERGGSILLDDAAKEQ